MNVKEEAEEWQHHTFESLIRQTSEHGFTSAQANSAIVMLQHANRSGNNVLSKRVTGHLVEGLTKNSIPLGPRLKWLTLMNL